MSAEKRRVHPSIHVNAKEAEFGPSQSCTCASDQWDRSNYLHPWYRPQSAGTLHRLDPRRPCEGSSGRPLPRDSWDVGRGGSLKPEAIALEVRREAAQRLTNSLIDNIFLPIARRKTELGEPGNPEFNFGLRIADFWDPRLIFVTFRVLRFGLRMQIRNWKSP